MKLNKRVLITFMIFALAGIGLSLSSNRAYAQTFGSNWSGSYYANTTFSGTALLRLDAAINFDWGFGSPDVSIPVDNFSARWVGAQTFVEGTYTFTLQQDDGARVFMDGTLIINQFNGPSTFATSIFVPAGAHTVTVEFLELAGTANIRFSWVQVGATGATAVFGVSPTVFVTAGPSPTVGPTFTPTVTALPFIPAGSLTATVIRASVLNVRAAPFIGADVVGRIRRSQTYAIVGRNARATWFLLQLSGFQAWAFGYYLAYNGNEFNAPIVSGAGSLGAQNATLNNSAVAVTEAGLRLRAEPSVNSAQIGRIGWGETIPIIGRTSTNEWYQTVWFGTVGWVYAPYLRIIEGDLNNVPIVR